MKISKNNLIYRNLEKIKDKNKFFLNQILSNKYLDSDTQSLQIETLKIQILFN